MYAVEFKTNIRNGVVEIPLEYKKIRESDNIRVIIMVENEEDRVAGGKSMFGNFLSLSKQVNSFTRYSREDLHER